MITSDTSLPILPERDACSQYAGDSRPTWYLVRAQHGKGGALTVRAFSTHLAATSPAPTLREAILAATVNAPWLKLRVNDRTDYFLSVARHFAQAESAYWAAHRTTSAA